MNRAVILTVALLLLTAPTLAVPLNLTAPDGIAAMVAEWCGSEPHIFMVCIDGSGYRYDTGSHTWHDLIAAPVPLEDIEDWTPFLIRTFDGRYFYRSLPYSEWFSLTDDPPVPLPQCQAPIPIEQESIGGIKHKFR